MDAIQLRDFSNRRLSEPEIINRILKGEKELYEILLRRNNQKLFRVIRSYFRDHAEIEDIMQNTYLKAYEKLYQFKHTSSYSTWLIRIGINEALLRLREKGRVYNLSEKAQSSERRAILEMPDNSQLNPESRIIRNESKQLLEDAIESLDLKYKTAYILKEVEGMSIHEIALCLDLSTANVKVRIHRAKSMLKESLYKLSRDTDVFPFGFSSCDRITENVIRLI